MTKFEIKEEFYLNDEKFRILSGAIHYYRIHPTQWEHTLYNLKALGYNTVETYLPWNSHEPKEGEFNFEGILDVEKFIETAEEMGLYVILRPSPYICAEWEFGGLPAWLLKYKDVRVRTTDEVFIEKVSNYFDELLPRLTKYQYTNGGPVLMMQVENEYGSYGNEKEYLRKIAKLMKNKGVDVPLFTSDGTWNQALDSGSLIEDGIFTTGNFGSESKQNMDVLQKFFDKHDQQWPLMCMEYWDGWFNRWGMDIVKRDPKDLADAVKEMMEIGSLNLYMFRGGTNFGFMNGCSARGNNDLPQVTSYDYDALLTEWGNPTEKFYEVQKATKEVYPEIEQMKPRSRLLKDYGSFKPVGKASLLAVASSITDEVKSNYPLTMEALDSNYGYVLYKTTVKNYGEPERLKVIEVADRVHIYIDGKLQATQYKDEIGEEIEFIGEGEEITIEVLVENLGRVNYGYKLEAPSQSKGIRGGVMINNHFHSGWTQYPLNLDAKIISKVEYTEPDLNTENKEAQFYKFDVEIDEIKDTFIDCSKYGKGVIFINGFNIGKYWENGPFHYLYVPSGLLKESNEIVVFETEGIVIEELRFSDKPVYKDMM